VHKLAPEPWHLRGPYPGQGGGSRKRARQTLGTCISFDKCCRCRRRLCLIMQRSQLCVFPLSTFPGASWSPASAVDAKNLPRLPLCRHGMGISFYCTRALEYKPQKGEELRSLAKSRRTAKRPTVLSSVRPMLTIIITLGKNYFLTNFRIFCKGHHLFLRKLVKI